MDKKQRKHIEIPIPTAAAADSPPPPWMELPEDVTANILQRLDSIEILESAQKVCITWRKVCLFPATWRIIHLKNRYGLDKELDLICRCAVDRSQDSTLLDLNIACIGDDALLNYIVHRSSHLRRLTLADCEISNSALTEAVKKLPELEELHLIMIPSIQGKDVQTFGISCPMLKSFTLKDWSEHLGYTEHELTDGDNYNEHALAIAKTMPNLRHLRLVAFLMTNKGLEAVLDNLNHLIFAYALVLIYKGL